MGKLQYIKLYVKKDYEGEFNILRHEKRLILRAYKRFNGDIGLMSESLEISRDSLLCRIIIHNLSKYF